MRLAGAVVVLFASLALYSGGAERPLGPGARSRDERIRGALALDGAVKEFALNALDHRMSIFDFETEGLGTSRQLDEVVREYVGNILFTGERFAVLENERYSGTFLDLGRGTKPDTEFSPFYALSVFKRRFEIRQFPFVDRYLPYEAVDSTRFFAENREPITSAEVHLAHVYLLRLFNRTRVADDRIFLLRVIDYVPGVRVTVLWRELLDRAER